MKILMLSTGMGLGGAETQIYSLSARMIELGHEVHIAWLTGQAGLALPQQAVTHPFNIHKTPLGLLLAIKKLNQLITEIEPDVVHAHMVHANLIARFSRLTSWPRKRRQMPKLICTAHSSNEGGKLLMLAYRCTDRLADLTTHVSEQAADAFVDAGAVTRDRIMVVPNGIDTARFRPDHQARISIRESLALTDKRVIMAVGRLEYPKNHASLIRAFVQIQPDYPDTHLVIVGDGSLRKKLESLVRSEQISQSVTFLGKRHDIPAILNAADIGVMSSRFEGFGLAIAEAMATEKLVVATNCGGAAKLLAGHGIVVPIENDQALARGLEEALEITPEARGKLGQTARELVLTGYSIDAMTQTWLRLYRYPNP